MREKKMNFVELLFGVETAKLIGSVLNNARKQIIN